MHTVQPFRIGPQQNATFMDSADHSHTGLAAKLDVSDGAPQMDKFAKTNIRKYASASAASAAQQAKARSSRGS